MTLISLFPFARTLAARLTALKPDPVQAVAPVVPNPSKPVDPDMPRLADQFPVRDPEPAAQDAARLRARGRFLARQEDWDQLSLEIRTADNNRALTPGLHSQAAMMCEGARQDITDAIVEGVASGDPLAVQAAVASLEPLFTDLPDCPVIAHIVAMSHVEAARAWRGAAMITDLPPERHDAYTHHMAAAVRLNDRFDPFEHDTPLWALVRCAVLEADPQPHARVADDFEDLIDLDPGNPHHMLDFGNALRPVRFGSWEILDAQARRTAARTADIWGAGGYTWVYLGALVEDQGAFRRLDVELFVEGLHDILARQPSQVMANRMAALIGYRLGGRTDEGSSRRRIADCFGWIVQDHLRELHPVIWAEAPARPTAPINAEIEIERLGRERAMSTLTEFFTPALDAGRRLAIGPDDLRVIKGG